MEMIDLSINDLCVCGSEKKQKKCHSYLNERSAIADVWRRYVILSTKIEEQRKSKNVDFICEKGCHDCCNEYFYVSQLEYFLIKNHMLNFCPDQFRQALSNARLQLQLLKKRYPDEYKRLNCNDIVSLEEVFDDKKHLKQFELCPFINSESGTCNAYDARPIICRLYGTSFSYGYCNKIAKKVIGWFGLHKKAMFKKMVNIPYDDFLRESIDVFPLQKGNLLIPRAYPIFYWLANDSLYEKAYLLATTRSTKEYITFISEGELTTIN